MLCAFYVIVEKPTATPTVQQLDVELPFFTRRTTARALQSRDIRRRSIDVRLREKCSVNAINAHCPDPVSNQFECGSIFGAV